MRDACAVCDRRDQRVKDAFFIVEPNQKHLFEIAKMLDAGILKAFVSAIVPLAEASAATVERFETSMATEKL